MVRSLRSGHLARRRLMLLQVLASLDLSLQTPTLALACILPQGHIAPLGVLVRQCLLQPSPWVSSSRIRLFTSKKILRMRLMQVSHQEHLVTRVLRGEMHPQ